MSIGRRVLNFYNNANPEFKEAIGDDINKKKLFCRCSYKFAGIDPRFNGNFTQYHINFCNDIFQNSPSPWWLENLDNQDIINFLNNIFIPTINIIYNKINIIRAINNKQIINKYSVPINYLQNTQSNFISHCNKCTICLECICLNTSSRNPISTCERTFLEVDKFNTRTYKIIYYENGKDKKYEGDVKNNKFDGQGIYYFKNGNKKYDGQFKENKFNGRGTEYYKNGSIYFEGIFNNNVRTMNRNLYNINGEFNLNKLIKKSKECVEEDCEMIGCSAAEYTEDCDVSKGEDRIQQYSKSSEEIPTKYSDDEMITCVECPKSSAEQTYIHLPCGHFFHTECLKNWLSRSNKCPMCKCDLK